MILLTMQSIILKNAAALQPFLHWYAVVITSDGTVHGKLTCFSFVLYSTFFCPRQAKH